tara:strand:- start:480 stop:881 length:402 start_codon:yes stop_codon:yes gene_type:complete
MNTLQGYVTSRSFNGYSLPVPVQNKLLRYHSKEQELIYLLPQCELFIDNNYMSLFETLKNLKQNSNLGMCSMYMLPDNKEKFESVIKFIKDKNIIMHFIFENVVTNYESIQSFNIDRNINFLINSNNDFIDLA